MKKLILICIIFLFFDCEKDDCKYCRLQTKDLKSGRVYYDVGTLECGQYLKNKQSLEPDTIGTKIYKFICE